MPGGRFLARIRIPKQFAQHRQFVTIQIEALVTTANNVIELIMKRLDEPYKSTADPESFILKVAGFEEYIYGTTKVIEYEAVRRAVRNEDDVEFVLIQRTDRREVIEKEHLKQIKYGETFANAYDVVLRDPNFVSEDELLQRIENLSLLTNGGNMTNTTIVNINTNTNMTTTTTTTTTTISASSSSSSLPRVRGRHDRRSSDRKVQEQTSSISSSNSNLAQGQMRSNSKTKGTGGDAITANGTDEQSSFNNGNEKGLLISNNNSNNNNNKIIIIIIIIIVLIVKMTMTTTRTMDTCSMKWTT
ncbi:NF-X1-type zinc finger-containing protein [Reticulomyxa filosa]|uniref:NF-X1-type zinc finger-containing protein n=1 Tax=Reticulomyxa filosa TaxID=46433 RepID=X6N8T7_RETFI|nr:NF-X1-type zinc finger-containing protein [Reticulomyxa filosa]|eukprot:ETO21717.1 NF-X1-type zinc finger-containing protein [Reticulomyxa filosa]